MAQLVDLESLYALRGVPQPAEGPQSVMLGGRRGTTGQMRALYADPTREAGAYEPQGPTWTDLYENWKASQEAEWAAEQEANDRRSARWDAGDYSYRPDERGPFSQKVLEGLGMNALTVGKLANAAKALPMDEASRMARAKEQGFVVDALHGRAGDYSRVNIPHASGNNTDVGSVGRGFYAAPADEEGARLASSYASMAGLRRVDGGENVMPLKLKMENPLVIEAPRKEAVERLSKEWGLGDMPEYNGSRPTNQFWASDFSSELQRRGYDGVVVKDGKRILEYMVPNESQARSRFATFDPSKLDSSDLLAGLIPALAAGGLGLQMMTPEEQSGALPPPRR